MTVSEPGITPPGKEADMSISTATVAARVVTLLSLGAALGFYVGRGLW
jgi:hypothetical protein